MLFGENAGRGDVRNRRLQLVLPAADDVAVASHHRVEPHARHISRIVLLALPDFGVQHVGALEEVGFGGARHETRHGDAGVLQFGAQREGERIDERFGAVVDGLIGAGHEAGDGPGEQNAALATTAHRPADELDQINRARDVRVDDVSGILEVLIEKPMAQPMAGIGEQRVDRPARRSGPELIHTLRRRQIRFNDGDVRSKTAESIGGRLNLRRSAATSRSNPSCAQIAASSSPMPDDAPVTIANGLLMSLPRPAGPPTTPGHGWCPDESVSVHAGIGIR